MILSVRLSIIDQELFVGLYLHATSKACLEILRALSQNLPIHASGMSVANDLGVSILWVLEHAAIL